MGRYNFGSVGAAMGSGIQEAVMQREMMRRQAVVEEAARRQQEALENDRQQNRMIQAETLERQRKADEVEQARRIVEESWKGDRPDETTQALLRKTGYGGAMRQGEGTTAEFMGQDPTSGQDFYSEATPGVMEMRGGAKWLNNQILEEGRQARADAAREAAAARQQTQIEAAAARQREIERAADEARLSNQRHQETLTALRTGQQAAAREAKNLPRELEQSLTTLAAQGKNRDEVSRYVFQHWPEISQRFPDLTGERMSQAIDRIFQAPKSGIEGALNEGGTMPSSWPPGGGGGGAGGARQISQAQLAALAKANGLSTEQVRQRIIAEAGASGQQLVFGP